MSFLRKIVGDDERILLVARLHWIYIVQGALWCGFLIFAGMEADYYAWYSSMTIAPVSLLRRLGLPVTETTPFATILFSAAGLLIFAVHLFKVLGTEIALTSQRIIHKTGILIVNTEEIDLVEIRAETVHHGLLGRLLGYGRLKLDSRFVGDVYLPAVHDPYRLVKAMNGARAHVHDPMTDAIPGRD